MQFLITRRRRLGVALSPKEVRDAKPVKGDVNMNEVHSTDLGRATVEAFILIPGPLPPPLPSLIDAKVTGLGAQGMNITGIEEVDGAYYFQSWWCRLE